MRDTFGWLLFRVIGNSLKFSITQKGTNVPMMRTRAKQKHVASDRARRENVPRHILFYGEAYKCYLQFYSKCDTLLSSIPICEAVDTFQKGMEQK